MNFFEHQAAAQRQSRRLVWSFGAAVLVVSALSGLLISLVLGLGFAKNLDYSDALLIQWASISLAAGLVLLLILVASIYKVQQLKAGGSVVARQLGGVAVSRDCTDARQRRLRNVVEEMAIASGLPVPEIFLLPQEQGINAFAAGYSPADAAIAVSRGALEKLNRDELQGVVAHEFSHILNGDMRLNIRLIGMSFGLLALTMIGREIAEARPRRAAKGLTVNLLGFGLLLLGSVGLLAARLLKAGVSRQREYLADASAVQFTRQTQGIADALKKVAGLDAGSYLQTSQAEVVSHMLFGEGQSLAAWFATHPPLEQRIQRLQPSFRITQLAALAEHWNAPDYYSALDDAPVLSAGLAAKAAAGAEQERPAQALVAAAVVRHAGAPTPDDYRRARWVHGQIPQHLRRFAASTEQAAALLMALLLTDTALADRKLQGENRAAIAKDLGPEAAALVEDLVQELALLPPAYRLPLASLALPSLHDWPAERLQGLRQLAQRLQHADGQLGAFEWALGELLASHIDDWLAPAAAPAAALRLAQVQPELARLFALLADAGTADAQQAQSAALAGWRHIFGSQQNLPPTSAAAAWQDLSNDLRRLDALAPTAKQILLEAMVTTLAHDGLSSIGEVELLRVVSARLHCPLPPELRAEAQN